MKAAFHFCSNWGRASGTAIGEALLKIASTIMVLSLTDTIKHFAIRKPFNTAPASMAVPNTCCHFIKKNLNAGTLITVALDAKNA